MDGARGAGDRGLPADRIEGTFVVGVPRGESNIAGAEHAAVDRGRRSTEDDRPETRTATVGDEAARVCSVAGELDGAARHVDRGVVRSGRINDGYTTTVVLLHYAVGEDTDR